MKAGMIYEAIESLVEKTKMYKDYVKTLGTQQLRRELVACDDCYDLRKLQGLPLGPSLRKRKLILKALNKRG